MDHNALRERLLSTDFKPKEKDIDTPYLPGLEKEFKLVGITGKQNLDFEEQATEQVIGKDGTITGKVNGRKIVGLIVQYCLRSRETGEPVYTLVDVLGKDGDGNGELLDLDSEVFKPLVQEISTFVGRRPAAEIKSELKKTSANSETIPLPLDSPEPEPNSSQEPITQN